ncbi:hypothetical protein [Streptomyces sp. NPDC000994]
MAWHFHDHAGVGALFVKQGRASVAQVMEADLTDFRAGAQALQWLPVEAPDKRP